MLTRFREQQPALEVTGCSWEQMREPENSYNWGSTYENSQQPGEFISLGKKILHNSFYENLPTSLGLIFLNSATFLVWDSQKNPTLKYLYSLTFWKLKACMRWAILAHMLAELYACIWAGRSEGLELGCGWAGDRNILRNYIFIIFWGVF